MQLPDGLQAKQTLDGLEVVLSPPTTPVEAGDIQGIAGLLCALAGLLCGGQIATSAGWWLPPLLAAGALLGGLLGLTAVTSGLVALQAQSEAQRTQRVRISNQGIVVQTPGREAEHIPFSSIAAVSLRGGVLAVVRDDQERLSLGEEQPAAVLRWLHDALQERLVAWRAASSTADEVPAALRALRERP